MKKSTKVVCIDNGKIEKLEKYKIYTVKNVSIFTISLEGIENSNYKYQRFILLSEYRKLKLNKLNECNL